ncbi:hypothetical protein [Bacteroidetes bacterium endosymbiont of Geopemphigus sp.]|uniref:hypothetical protein n=1 Tax=Bacteroidetes bacterium endosymbiont of Geopemphigus sp. TaxID=2047937 RepID=UPI0011AFA06B|nr:hypothetical protein [Bacteroidetes bacterium endosymbiont of Geopemphigus sp.]
MLFTLMLSCNFLKRKNKNRGQLIVTERIKPWNIERLYGIVKIPGGTFIIGQSDLRYEWKQSPGSSFKNRDLVKFFHG